MSNKPAIRFVDFTDVWEQRKLSDLAEIVGGGTPDTNNPAYWDGDIDWYAPAEMEGQRYATSSVRKITELGLQKSSAKMLPAHRTVLFTSRAGIGKMAILQRSAATNQGFQSMVLKDGTDPYFIYSMGNKIKDKAEGVASGSTFLEISGKMLGNLEIMVPALAEQKEIASFFRGIDDLITLQLRKYEKLKQFKSSMLSKMFPCEGENVPEIRFAGFTNAWEQRKVSEICSISTGKSNTQDKIDDGEYPFYVRSPIIERSNIYLYDEEAVLTVGDGVGTGKVFHYVNGKYDLHQRVYRLFDFSDDVDAKFFYHWFSENFYDRVMSMTAKTSVDSVRLEMIADMEMNAPSYDEQKKISGYMDHLDSLITLHHCKLDKLKQFKSAILSKMFV